MRINIIKPLLLICSLGLIFCISCKKKPKENTPPNIPQTPSGPSSGQINISYDFSTFATDPDGDSVSYQFDWGDGTQSNWSSFVPSGTSVTMSKSWSNPGTYYIKARAKDRQDSTSNWSDGHQITISGGGGEYPDTVVATVRVGSGPSGVAALPNGNYLYVTNYGDDNVSVIRTSDNVVVATVPVGDYPWAVAVLPNGNYLYVANYYSNNVSVIRTSDNTVVATVPVGGGPLGVAVLPNGEYVYVTNAVSNNVSVIRTSDNTVVATVPVGSKPVGVAVLPNGNYVYVANYWSDNVSVIRTSDNTIVATIPVGDDPRRLAVLPNGEYVYVTNEWTGSVSVIGRR